MTRGGAQTFRVVGTGPAAYEEYLVPTLFRPLAETLVPLAGVRPGNRVLDVACGTGAVARVAAAAGGHVTGLDLNPAMLAVAREVTADVQWLPGDAATLPFPDGSYDVVYCQQGLQFVPDQATALREMRRVLAPGGRLAVALWRELDRAPGFAALIDVLDRHAGPAVGDILRSPFARPAAGPPKGLVAAAGFTAARLRIHVFAVRFASIPAFFAEEVAASPLAEPVGELPDSVRAAMVDDLATVLSGYTDDDGVVFPIESYLVTART